jgi:hypothetical protein
MTDLDQEQKTPVETSHQDIVKDEDNKEISKFLETYDKAGLDPSTSPSAVCIGGSQEINLEKLDPKQIEQYLWMHPVVPRGVEIKSNRMTRRGYTVMPGEVEDTEYIKYCEDILENSGGITGIKNWIKDTYGFGNGFRTLVPNKSKTAIIRLNAEHPIYFDIAKYREKDGREKLRGKYKILKNDKKPIAYTQLTWDDGESKFVPTGKEIPRDRVAHLFFDSWGDEPLGISLVQYLHLTLKYLMNMEEAAAETIYRNGFVQKKVTTEIRTEKGLKELGKNLTELNRRDAVILPKGTDVENLVPGSTEFATYHERFITLLAIRLGIPKPILTMDGTSTNKATLREQMKDVSFDYNMDEITVEDTIINQVFKPSCSFKYKEKFDMKKVPKIKFNAVPEDKELETEWLES